MSNSANRRLIALSLALMVIILCIDLSLPLGVAGGVPYVAVILVSLWFAKTHYIVNLGVVCSALVILGYFFSPDGGELWKVLFNRSLAIFAIWITVVLSIKWRLSEQAARDILRNTEKEKQLIYKATIHGAQHITNNLLNQLKLVEMEIEKHPDFDSDVVASFDTMMSEANSLMQELSSVDSMDEESITLSVYPKAPDT